MHRDIKPANFLVDRAWKVKVCDFGLASNSKAQAGAGTPQYMAPELWENKHYNEKVCARVRVCVAVCVCVWLCICVPKPNPM